MTRSSIARIIRYGQATGSLPEGTTPVGMAAYVRGFTSRCVHCGHKAAVGMRLCPTHLREWNV